MCLSAVATLLPVHGLCYKLVSELDYECTITFSTRKSENTLMRAQHPSGRL